MLKIYLKDFFGEKDSINEAMENISAYFNSVKTDIKIHCDDGIMLLYGNKLTFPNMVYAENITVKELTDISKVFPDLKKVKRFNCQGLITNIGNIEEIDIYDDLWYYYFMFYSNRNPLKCEALGYDRYAFSWKVKGLFSNKKEYRIVKVNRCS